MSAADKILDIISLRHPFSHLWRNFPNWHRERLTMLIEADSIPKFKHMLDVLLRQKFPRELNSFWDYRGPSLSLIRTDSRCLVENRHSQPVQVTSHNFETVRRTHQAEVYECLCMRHLSIKLKAENVRMLRLKTYLAGFHDMDIRESIEKAIVQIIRRSI